MPRYHPISGTSLALVAVGGALIASSTLWGGYPLGGGVPITLQTLAVLLVGAVLGAYRGSAAVFVYLALGTAGVPVWAGHVGGAAIWTTPRAGFLAAFVLAAFVTGWIAERLATARKASFSAFLGATMIGAMTIGGIGWTFVGIRAGLTFDDTLATLTPFLPGDIIKAFLAAVVAGAVHAAYPALLAPVRASAAPSVDAPTPRAARSTTAAR